MRRTSFSSPSFLLVLLLSTAGCTSTRDRLNDLTDVVHVHYSAASGGVLLNLGPAQFGFFGIHGGFGALGLGGVRGYGLAGDASGFLIPFHVATYDEDGGGHYSSKWPGWGSVGLELAAFVGIGVRLDIVEFADFVVGFAGLDFAGDDEEAPETPADAETADEE